MASPSMDQILARVGGATLLKYGVPWRRARIDGTEPEAPTFARADAATCATFEGANGRQQTALADRLRLDYSYDNGGGLLLEGSRINVALWGRDLTNAAWVKTNCTALKNITGIDNIGNSASRLTANAANATCLQSITGGGVTRCVSVYVERLTGTGTVEITMNGGTNWTPITLGSWQRFQITATMGTTSIGFRIQTSGDAIGVDFVQCELGNFASSPIATTSASVTRALDALTFPFGAGVPVSAEELTVYTRFDAAWPRTGTQPSGPGVWRIGEIGVGLTGWDLFRNDATATLRTRFLHNNIAVADMTLTLPSSGVIEALVRLEWNGSQHRLYFECGGNSNTSAAFTVNPALPFTGQALVPGNRANGSDPGFIDLYDLIVAHGNFSLAEMQAVA